MKTEFSDTRKYQALLEKDRSFEGIFFVGVKTTGIFCRPTCCARKPKRTNVEFFSTTQDALRSGYRPCKLCHPMMPLNGTPSWIDPLLKQIKKESGYRFSDSSIRKLGMDPNRVRRWFKSNHRMTFQGYLRALRLGKAFGYLTDGGKVVDAAFDNGYDSLSGFSSAFKKLTGKAPTRLQTSEVIRAYQIHTPLGPMLAASTDLGICLLEFTDRRMIERELIDLQKRFRAKLVLSQNRHIQQLKQELNEYFNGERRTFRVSLDPAGTSFQKKVWKVLQKIPYGETRSYKEQAIAVGNPKAVRAVARANGENKIAIIIPCHRVIGSDGSLTGYAGGLDRKRFLLNLEKSI